MTTRAAMFLARVVTKEGAAQTVLIVNGYESDFGWRVMRDQGGRSFVDDGGRLVECEAGGPKTVVRSRQDNPKA